MEDVAQKVRLQELVDGGCKIIHFTMKRLTDASGLVLGVGFKTGAVCRQRTGHAPLRTIDALCLSLIHNRLECGAAHSGGVRKPHRCKPERVFLDFVDGQSGLKPVAQSRF